MSSEALFREAYAHHREGRFTQALDLYRQILTAEPAHFDALFLSGILFAQSGDLAKADEFLERAVRRNPLSADALCLHGRVLQRLDRHADAIASFEAALRLAPTMADAAAGLAQVLMERGKARVTLKRFEDAVADFNRALALKPDAAEIFNYRGVALAQVKRFDAAIADFDRLLDANPSAASVRLNRASALIEAERHEEAAREFETILSLDANAKYALGNLLYCRMKIFDWRDFAAERDRALAELREGRQTIPPLAISALSDWAEDHFRCAEIYTRAGREEPAQAWRGSMYAHGKIRIAYCSADFRTHAVASVLAGVIEAHDRSSIDCVGVSFGPDDGSPMRARLMRAFDSFIDARAMSDEAIAHTLREKEIDIAVDLTGYTNDSRPGIFGYRPAPVQVNYLGYSGTMASGNYDYIVADRIVIPEEHKRFYSEKVVWLPGSYMPAGGKRAMTGQRPTRAEAGLPETGFVFCCFNIAYKINPKMFDIWMRLLQSVEGSVLWLPKRSDTACRNLIREAEARGVAAARLIFAPSLPKQEDHLARMGLADLFLDTLPCNAQVTANDALSSGLPLLACVGGAFPARVAASQLLAAGLPELVTHSLEDYETAALRLARDRAGLARLRAKIAQNLKSEALFDTTRYCRHLEAAFATMRERQRRGEAPSDFAVAALAQKS